MTKAKENSTPTRRMSASECARLAGISRQRASTLLKRGLTATEVIESVRQRRQAEQSAIEQQQAHQAGKGDSMPAPLSLSLRRKEEALAASRELDLLERRGQLVPASSANLWMASCVIGARQVFEGTEDLAEVIVREPDVFKVRKLLRREIERGLAVLAGFGTTMTNAFRVQPLNPALPANVRKALQILAEYSHSEYSRSISEGASRAAVPEGADD